MNILTFPPFIPPAVHPKDFSALEESLRSLPCYQRETASAFCAFIKGSSVSSYDNHFVRAHLHSDIDVVVLSSRPRMLNQYACSLLPNSDSREVPVDIRNVNQTTLDHEVTKHGYGGATTLFDFVMDSHPLKHDFVYDYYRRKALLIFLRLGLGQYHQEMPSRLTPSGAMKVINQAKIVVNPLRWWSVYYAFSESPTADQNVARYYHDVAAMIHANFPRVGQENGEEVYNLPFGLAVTPTLSLLRAGYYFSKITERLNSKPMISWNDLQKARKKLVTLAYGVVDGKKSIDTLFANHPRLLEMESG